MDKAHVWSGVLDTQLALATALEPHGSFWTKSASPLKAVFLGPMWIGWHASDSGFALREARQKAQFDAMNQVSIGNRGRWTLQD